MVEMPSMNHRARLHNIVRNINQYCRSITATRIFNQNVHLKHSDRCFFNTFRNVADVNVAHIGDVNLLI